MATNRYYTIASFNAKKDKRMTTIKDFIKIAEMLDNTEKSNNDDVNHKQSLASCHLGKMVILRCDRSGVHYGILKEIQAPEAILDKSRRIHYWEKRFTLTDIALNGLEKNNKTRISKSINNHVLHDVIEVILCTSEACEILNDFKSHEA